MDLAVAFAGLNAAYDTAKRLLDVRDDINAKSALSEVQSKIMEAQQAAITAQQEQALLLKRIGDLEKELERLRNWDNEKKKYNLVCVSGGREAFVYCLKNEIVAQEPRHYICPICYEDGKKSILQARNYVQGRARTLHCHACGNEILTSGFLESHQRPRRG